MACGKVTDDIIISRAIGIDILIISIWISTTVRIINIWAIIVWGSKIKKNFSMLKFLIFVFKYLNSWLRDLRECMNIKYRVKDSSIGNK